MFDSVKKAAATDQNGVEISCADGWVRNCVPIIAAITTDYEEQVRLTGVVSGRQCTMCTIHPDLREDLEIDVPWRTQEDTKLRIFRQRAHDGVLPRKRRHKPGDNGLPQTTLSSHADGSSESSDSDSELDPDKRVHDINCFAFNHRYMEINQSMMVDILHQLLKGVMMHVFAWTNAFIADQAQNKKGTRMGQGVEAASKGATRHRRKADKSKVAKGIVEAIVDRRFASIPPYPTLRVFSHMSSVTEWTGAEQKSILRQILPVFVPLLEEIGTEDAKEAIRFLRATVDFITLAMYESHDTETLRYFDLALCRMNQHKEVFRKYRNPKAEEDDRHFNFPT